MSGRGGSRGGRGGRGRGPQSLSQQYLASAAREAGIDIRSISSRNTNGIDANYNDIIFPDLELHSGEKKVISSSTIINKNTVCATLSGSGPHGPEASQEAASEDQPQNHPHCPRSPNTTKLISKSRQLRHYFQNNSPCYIRTRSGTNSCSSSSEVIGGGGGGGNHGNITTLKNPVEVLLGHCLGGKRRISSDGDVMGEGMFFPEELLIFSTSSSRVHEQHRQRQKSNRNHHHQQQQRNHIGREDDGGDLLPELHIDLPMRSNNTYDGSSLIFLDENEDQQHQSSSSRRGNDDGGEGDNQEEVDDENNNDEDGEESDGVDYDINYYESEGDDYGSGNSDGEPTY